MLRLGQRVREVLRRCRGRLGQPAKLHVSSDMFPMRAGNPATAVSITIRLQRHPRAGIRQHDPELQRCRLQVRHADILRAQRDSVSLPAAGLHRDGLHYHTG